MAGTTITLHLPAYRTRALELQKDDAREAESAYDGNVGAYVTFLKDEAKKADYEVATDQRDEGPAYSIEATGHADKQAAHDWLAEQPDIWNWIP